MNHRTLSKVALRYRAMFIDIQREHIDMQSQPTIPVLAFLTKLNKNGYTVSEELLHALNGVSADTLAETTDVIDEALGIHLNWAPLVKGWDTPTGESRIDHIITFFANILGPDAGFKGTRLQCGHLIPEGTFPIERYNGCPFCGQPFETANYVYTGQGSQLKELRLFTLGDIEKVLRTLLASPTPPDATQKDSLKLLLKELPLPNDVEISMKETAMIVAKHLADTGNNDAALKYIKTPTDILRYLWYEKTGQIQLIEPKTLVLHAKKLYRHIFGPLDKSEEASTAMKQKLKLKYTRKDCKRIAQWLNATNLTAKQAAENMNPKRGMWVRVIRALRLSEYSHKPGMEHLQEILDVFYNQDYTTFNGMVDQARIANNADTVLTLLKQRPGLFARCLFATMLRFGYEKVLAEFETVADQMPARLLLSLGNAANIYFDTDNTRLAHPITGVVVPIEHNAKLMHYDNESRKAMAKAVNELYQKSMQRRFAAQATKSKTIYIEPSLFDIPISVGDRSTTIQDTSCALPGTRFAIEGDSVRLFLQWGKGLHAQWLDMDLSCRISLPKNKIAECAYYHLNCVGAKHSGDIREIPEMVGTAEYIELSIPQLEKAKAKYVTFTCNAYSNGALSPNLMVGWMNSAHPMKVSEKDGVAYDPSCVQHIVRISESNLSKGLVFGVLDVAKREIIWLEMPFTAQTLRGANSEAVEALLHKLQDKLSVGKLLSIKAEAQNLVCVDTPEQADEQYTYEWALNPSEVAALLNG
ncbi:MAG: hypothetical protein K6F33_01590 [Bacteroidales bacterium]|nr:hypothetical protein [Bacteroidales bacterium]